MKALWVMVGAGIGAPARYLVDLGIRRLHGTSWPLGTLVINVLGSFILGLVITSGGNSLLILGVGFAGAFTTWSTLAMETHTLFVAKKHSVAWLNLFATLVLGIAAAALARAL
jgi:CrcB protein